MKRQIYIGGVRNCRDLGGLVTADGRTVRPDCLLRSACLSGVPQEDIAALASRHRLSLVIDLRTDDESEQKPETMPEGVAYRHMPIFDAAKIGITHEKGEKWDPERPSAAKADMPALYRLMVETGDCQRALSRVLSVIMAYDFSAGSVLWHCSEGKDRCGLVAALLLGALGVSRETIMEDYLLTNEYRRSIIKSVAERMPADTPPEIIERWQKANGVQEEHLRAVFEAIEERFGSTEAYLEGEFGLDATALAALRDRYLE